MRQGSSRMTAPVLLRNGAAKIDTMLGVVAILVCTFLPVCGGIVLHIETIFFLVAGWLFFLADKGPDLSWNRETVALGCGALALYVVLVHVAGSVWSRAEVNRTWHFRWTGKITLLSSVAFVAAIALVGLTHMTVWAVQDDHAWVSHGSASGSFQRTQERNYLKQFGIAQHSFHDLNEEFLTYAQMKEYGESVQSSHLHSWQTYLLPLMESGDLFNEIDLTQPWDALDNKPAFETDVIHFVAPADLPRTDPETGYALTSFAGNSHLFAAEKRMRADEITKADGTSNTIMIGEVIHNLRPWGKPGNWRDPALGVNKSPHGFGSPWQGGAFFTMADGSVQWLSDKLDPEVMKALATPDGGEDIGMDEVRE